MTAVIFLGPTLPTAKAREILDAVYLPPAVQGDLTEAAVEHRPDVIGLIDGGFLQTMAVWHKEILFALDRGIQVFGASSMGALRAAETAAFGMQGIGEIYRMYADGELNDDDEVALAHGLPEHGYRKLSEPMVNVRATLLAAQAAGLLGATDCDRLLAVAKGIYFADRTFPRIFAAAADAGVGAGVCEQVAAFVDTGYVDLKANDAVELLHAVKAAVGRPPQRPAFDFVRTTQFNTLYSRGRRVHHHGVAVALEDIANHAALHDDGFDGLNFHAMNRVLVGVFADHLGLEIGEQEIADEIARFRRVRDLERDEALAAWLDTNDLDADELRDLLALVAACRRMHRWFIIANWMERTVPAILDELRLAGTYERWADRAAAQERLLHSRGDIDPHAALTQSLDELVAEHEEWSGRTFPVEPRTWAEEAGFHSPDNLRAELKRARAARRAMLELLAGADTGAAVGGDP